LYQTLERLARVIDADDTNRPGENTIFGPPDPQFPDVTKEVSEANGKGLIELPANWIGRYVQVITT
jgi:hypothetical protein